MSIHTDLPRSTIDAAIRCTKSMSRREYETNTSANSPRLRVRSCASSRGALTHDYRTDQIGPAPANED